MKFQEIPPFCTSPEPCANQWFNVCTRCALGVHGRTHPISPKKWEISFLSVSGPKSALSGPAFDFCGPCVKPFINTTFWEVFWRPRAAKVRFGPEKLKIHSRTGFSWKKCFSRKKLEFRENGKMLTKPYHFCFKKLLRKSNFAVSGAILLNIAQFCEIH